MTDNDAGADDEDVTAERRAGFVIALNDLPRLTRAVFLLHRLDGHSYAEIAWRCGISVDEVVLRMGEALIGVLGFRDGHATLRTRIRRAMRPWRVAWARWRRTRRDRQLGL
ncbi:RNA polymerase sigma factor [Sphingomonas sp. PR090111-T3T-6A]|uniref:RNA polymerase sigma factor n=1 Tax=Sphingomonas sp. PR090111-T3T-6A TaxID=685778 RepID=UPI000374E13F|nr:sigma-70 region 4 domain-containing protein [Sphingomonas sp. PR090111-T3T-6A]